MGFPVILGVVVGETVQDENLAPLSALIESSQELIDDSCVHLNDGFACTAGLINLRQGCNRIGHHHWVGVTQQLLQAIKEALLLHQVSIYIMQLRNRHCGCLPDIGVLVLQAFPKWFTQILSDLLNSDATHSSHSQGSDKGVGVLTILDECVDCHNGHVRLGLGIVHKVEIHQLLQLQVVSLHAVDHVWKEGRHILPTCHAGNHLLYCFSF